VLTIMIRDQSSGVVCVQSAFPSNRHELRFGSRASTRQGNQSFGQPVSSDAGWVSRESLYHVQGSFELPFPSCSCELSNLDTS
jgi:hypothetical protein